MDASPNPEIAALEDALYHLKRAAVALDERDKARRRRPGVYINDRLARRELHVACLRIKNELERLHQQCVKAGKD
jgi:hypothetical protein